MKKKRNKRNKIIKDKWHLIYDPTVIIYPNTRTIIGKNGLDGVQNAMLEKERERQKQQDLITPNDYFGRDWNFDGIDII